MSELGLGCLLAGPGRGDCEHFVGLPGKSIPGQHDGPDDTVDVYGKPNGWCWSCWKDYRLSRLHRILVAVSKGIHTDRVQASIYMDDDDAKLDLIEVLDREISKPQTK